MVKQLKVGVIGCGGIAKNVHFPCFQRIKGVEVSCIADASPSSLKEVSRTYGIRKAFSDHRDLLDEDLDFVSICTPNHLHARMCVDAAKAGKNVLVEKPLALSTQEAMEIKRAVENNVKLCVIHNELYNRAMLPVVEMMRNEKLGRILSVHAVKHTSVPNIRPGNWRKFGFLSPAESGGELFEFIHPLYLLDFFGGPAKDIYVIGRRVCESFGDFTDVRAVLAFKSGSIGYLEMLGLAATDLFLVDIHGTGSSVRVDLFNKTYRTYQPHPQLNEVVDSVRDAWSFFKVLIRKDFWHYTYSSHLLLISEFVRSIREDKEPPINVENGIRAVRIAEAIKKQLQAEHTISLCKPK